ncbi:hypothetical protein BJX76DRAFT_338356 [Aspergillus varians]
MSMPRIKVLDSQIYPLPSYLRQQDIGVSPRGLALRGVPGALVFLSLTSWLVSILITYPGKQ